MKIILLVFSLLFFYRNSTAQLLAFPTAEGAGKFTTGGRSATTIYIVNSLIDNASSGTTSGTFRYACTNGSAARIIVFRVSGTIHLASPLSLKANTTIAGQTAPGEGICIADFPVQIAASNIIVRYLRFRLGDKNQLITTPANCGLPVTPFASNPSCIPTANASGNDDAFGDNGGGRANIIIDHCSVSWSNDEAFTIYKGNNVTLQWNFISEPLNYSYHVESSDTDYELHAFGGIWGGAYATMHHNLIAHCKGRLPRFDGTRNIATELVDFRNNVIYNWSDYNTNGGEGGNYNVVNNYYKYGPSTASVLTNGVNRRNMIINPYKSATAAITTYGKYYLIGNYCDNSTTVTSDNWLGVSYNNGTPTAPELTAMKQLTDLTVLYPINMQTSTSAYDDVLAKAGCALPNRDTLDIRIVNDVLNRTGGLIDCQGKLPHGTPYSTSQTAWPALANGTVQIDADSDGMPDNWEAARGVTTATTYQSTSGYNNIENYINGDTITAVGILNTCITAKKINSTNSGNWLHARDTTFNGYLNTNYTSAVDSNHIVAAILDNGNFGEFTVSYYTSSTNRTVNSIQYLRRNITITPTNPALITSPVTVRFYLSVAEFNALKAADPSIVTINDVKIMKAADNNCITAMPSTYDVITPTARAVFGTYQNGYYLEFQTSSFSTFTVVSNVVVAPVKLSLFNVSKENNFTASIKWITEQETNSKNFFIQRSVDGINFISITNVAAAGNSTSPLTYQFKDIENKTGVYYYRLAQVDLNGTINYSVIKKLNFSNKVSITIYPNPAQESITINVENQTDFIIIITDVFGRKIKEKKILNNAILNISNYNTGTYFLQIKNQLVNTVVKFLKM